MPVPPDHPDPLDRLIAIMTALRTPDTGCAWDLEQTFETIAPYTIEEAYEVADAIARGSIEDLKEELGDLLLQVVFHARIAEEAGAFAFHDVAEAISTKLIRRHPHVFAAEADRSPTAIKRAWERIKAEERREKALRLAAQGEPARPSGLLDSVPATLPALTTALKLQEKAATVGFDWNDIKAVLRKIVEEAGELTDAARTGDKAEIQGEVGDLLFAAVNLARHLHVDPEAALAATNVKFRRRFSAIETALELQGRTPAESNLKEMDALWNAAKAAEKITP